MKKLVTRSWILLALDGRTVLVVNKLFTNETNTTAKVSTHFRLITKSSFNRINKATSAYNADSVRAHIDNSAMTTTLTWSTMRHYNGVMLSPLDYMNALAQDNPVEFFRL